MGQQQQQQQQQHPGSKHARLGPEAAPDVLLQRHRKHAHVGDEYAMEDAQAAAGATAEAGCHAAASLPYPSASLTLGPRGPALPQPAAACQLDVAGPQQQ